MSVCPARGSETAYSGQGRPRTYWVDCSPPGSNGTVRREAWFRANRERLEQERREAHEACMPRWRELLRQRKEQTEEKRRRREARVA